MKAPEGAGPVLLFDDECGLCHRVVRLLLRLDPGARLRFAPLQGPGAQAFLRAHGLPAADFDSLAYLFEGGAPPASLAHEPESFDLQSYELEPLDPKPIKLPALMGADGESYDLSGPDPVRAALASGQDVIMRIDVQGAATIRKLVPDAVLIFLTTESEEDMVQRLLARQTETPEGLKLRIATARQELKRANEFDYAVINKQAHLDETVNDISAIICAEHHRVIPRKVTL